MSGVTFIVDAKIVKIAVVIDLPRHKNLGEDFYDAWPVQSRSGEPRENLAFVKRRLEPVSANG